MVIYLDGASLEDMEAFPMVHGYTTNPTLARKSGVEDYETWGRAFAGATEKPVSVEVVADEHNEMYRQAKVIASWGSNVYVKIPVTNTAGEFSGRVIKKLSKEGIKINVTAIMTIKQIKEVIKALDKSAKAIISVFAGRIADTGVEPRGTMRFAVKNTRPYRGFDVLWASPRQVLDIRAAERYGVDIITVSRDILVKLALQGKDLTEYSRETVEMFYKDATLSGYTL